MKFNWFRNGNGGSTLPPDPTVYRDSAVAQAPATTVVVDMKPVVAAIDQLTARLVLQKAPEPEPQPIFWPAEMAQAIDRIAALARTLAEREERDDTQVTTALNLVVEDLEEVVANLPLPDPRPELTAELTRGLAELPIRLGEMIAAERERAIKSATAAIKAATPPVVMQAAGSSSGGGSSRNAAPRRAPPSNLPPLNPKEPPVTPLVPAPYVGGSLWIPGGDVWGLLYLIQKQLNVHCPGSSYEFSITWDDSNAESIFVGSASPIAGALSADNYAFELDADSPTKIYRSAFPGTNTPVGELQVFATGGGWVHVEVQS